MGSGLLAIYASYRIDVTSFAGPTAGAMLAIMGFALVMLASKHTKNGKQTKVTRPA